jgi:hypothetical protein
MTSPPLRLIPTQYVIEAIRCGNGARPWVRAYGRQVVARDGDAWWGTIPMKDAYREAGDAMLKQPRPAAT